MIPLALIAGDAVRQMGAERLAQLRQEYGLDQSLGVQYGVYLGRLLKGDLGRSYRYSGDQSVAQILANRLGWTLLLVAMSLFLATLIGTLLGIWAARRANSGADLGLLSVVFLLRSIPSFWLAMIVIPVFAIQLGLFPSGNSYAFPRLNGIAGVLDILHHAALPAFVLTLVYIPTPFVMMRAALLSVLSADYIRTARAKGLPEVRVLYRHAVRNTLLPVVTSFTLEIGQMLGGAVLIETVFNYRGIGSMMFEAAKSRDYPLLQGGFLVFTLGVLTINLVTDWLYPRLDPRLKDASR